MLRSLIAALPIGRGIPPNSMLSFQNVLLLLKIFTHSDFPAALDGDAGGRHIECKWLLSSNVIQHMFAVILAQAHGFGAYTLGSRPPSARDFMIVCL